MRIVSVPGRLVRDFVTQRPVDAEGIDIDPTHPTWARLLADGDVEEGTPRVDVSDAPAGASEGAPPADPPPPPAEDGAVIAPAADDASHEPAPPAEAPATEQES